MTLSYFLAIIMAYVIITLFATAAHYMPRKAVKAVMIAVYVLMLAGEAVKQVYAFKAEVYDMWNAPLHFSSTFYLSIGLSLLGCGALRRIGQPALFVGSLILIVMMIYTPHSIFGVDPAYVFSTADSTHGYFFHMAVVLQFAVMVACGWYRPKLYDPVIFAAFLFVYGLVAIPPALKYGLNFAGLVTSYIPLLETFRLAYGYAAYYIVYYLCVCVLGLLTIYIYYFIYSLYIRRYKKY